MTTSPSWVRFFKVTLILIVVGLVVTSFRGTFRADADEYVNQSLKQGVSVYATARATNAIISVAKTAHTPIADFGEILDPIDDLVERFSTLLEISIGSLILQKMLLEITSHKAFSYALACSGFFFILSLFAFKPFLRSVTSRIFFTLVFCRFSILAVLLLNCLISETFITKKIEVEAKNVAQIQEQTTKFVDSKSSVAQQPANSTQPNSFLASAGRVLAEIKQVTIDPILNIWNKFDFQKIKANLDKAVESMLQLMTLFFLKTILLPILFFFGFKKLITGIWRMQLGKESALFVPEGRMVSHTN